MSRHRGLKYEVEEAYDEENNQGENYDDYDEGSHYNIYRSSLNNSLFFLFIYFRSTGL